ncbi:hypothetical protein Hypma_001994 [Hypsizygus marmoreus]|uniref:Uncharacterized protein n=1 Tax=Hypsizygus marmoreus TaxID=39966 RepID=A0A369J9P7_HYPMA|nr:hypothetical protein Hypma_001994 [Hypsizygus marmoreus]
MLSRQVGDDALLPIFGVTSRPELVFRCLFLLQSQVTGWARNLRALSQRSTFNLQTALNQNWLSTCLPPFRINAAFHIHPKEQLGGEVVKLPLDEQSSRRDTFPIIWMRRIVEYWMMEKQDPRLPGFHLAIWRD